MSYNWNGTGNGGTNLPAGVYYYYISAATNGSAYSLSVGDAGGSGGGSPPSPDFAMSSGIMDASELWAVPSDDSSASPVPFALYPPGFDTNGLTVFSSITCGDRVIALLPVSRSSSFAASDSGGGSSPDGAGGGSSASSQNSPASPQRNTENPIVGISGLFGMAWDTYTANGTNVMSANPIPNIPGLPGSYIALDGYSGSAHLTYAPLPQFNAEAGNFETEMQLFGWKHTIVKTDNQFSVGDLTGSGTAFNNVSLGVIVDPRRVWQYAGLQCRAGQDHVFPHHFRGKHQLFAT